MDDLGLTAPDPSGTRPHRTYLLVLLTAVWMGLAVGLFGWAVHSPWPPLGEAPSQAQVTAAHVRVLVAGGVSVVLPSTGVALALRWDRTPFLAVFVCGATICFLLAGLLWELSSS